MQNTGKSEPRNRPKKSPVLKESAQKMEKAFNEGHELFTKLISVIPDTVGLLDMSGKSIFVNELGVKLFGYDSPSKVIGKNIFEFISLAEHKRARRGMAQRRKGNIGIGEYNMITKDGSLIPFEANGNVLRNADGTPFAYVSLVI